MHLLLANSEAHGLTGCCAKIGAPGSAKAAARMLHENPSIVHKPCNRRADSTYAHLTCLKCVPHPASRIAPYSLLFRWFSTATCSIISGCFYHFHCSSASQARSASSCSLWWFPCGPALCAVQKKFSCLSSEVPRSYGQEFALESCYWFCLTV